MRMAWKRAFIGALVSCGVIGSVVAGPPLSIDDPEILDPGSIELIVAATVDQRDSGDELFLPVLDLSYGLATDVQMSAVATRAVVNPDDGPQKSDVGPGAIGIKWRFMNSGAMQMSVAPFFETLLREGAADRGVAEDVEAWVLPVQFQYQFAAWRLNAEARYAAISAAENEWGYGVAAALPLTERIEALAELHGGADRSLEDNDLLYRIGADFTINERWHILASLGSSLQEAGDDDLDLQGYLGLQWFSGND